ARGTANCCSTRRRASRSGRSIVSPGCRPRNALVSCTNMSEPRRRRRREVLIPDHICPHSTEASCVGCRGENEKIGARDLGGGAVQRARIECKDGEGGTNMQPFSRRDFLAAGLAASAGLALGSAPAPANVHQQLLDLAERLEEQRRQRFAAVRTPAELEGLQ